MKYTLTINNREVSHLAAGEIKLTTKRIGAGQLTASLINTAELNYREGDTVILSVDDVTMFKGYVFKKHRNKKQIIETTCYDQIIYLKLNKETYVYTNMTASEIVQKIAGDFGLNTGIIADTSYKIPARTEDIQTLIDIIYTAIDLTVINTGNLFVLYDNLGYLTLKNIDAMRLDKIISAEATLIDYEYTTDIGTSTHNKIKLVRDNETTGRRDVFIEKDSSNINRWGLLQLHEKVSDSLTQGQVISLARRKLNLYNRVKRTLKLNELTADPNIRAGNSILANIPYLGDIHLNTWLVIERCIHTLTNSSHTMALEMTGDF